MTIPRIYQLTSLHTDQPLILTEEASHHVARVLRLNEGDKLILFNGDGHEYHAVIEKIKKHHVNVFINAAEIKNRESSLSIHLGQAISRGEKMDFTVQKAVELGVKNITPIFSERCNVQLAGERLEKRLHHWQAIAIHACEQCGRNEIPVVHAAKKTSDWLSLCDANLKIILDPTAEISLVQLLQKQQTSIETVDLLIGPEGGLGQHEIDQASYFKFHRINLGPRILRTETVALTTISILQSYCGDLK